MLGVFLFWVGCPLSHGWRRASVSAAASVGAGRLPLADSTRGGRREWTRVSEDGEGKLPAAPSHGLCGSAGGLPSQSPNGDSSPEGGAKSRLPLWGPQKSFARPRRKKRHPAAPDVLLLYRARSGLYTPTFPELMPCWASARGSQFRAFKMYSSQKYQSWTPGPSS